MARPEGFEPPTTWFEARYSIQLSYGRAEGREFKRSLRWGAMILSSRWVPSASYYSTTRQRSFATLSPPRTGRSNEDSGLDARVEPAPSMRSSVLSRSMK